MKILSIFLALSLICETCFSVISVDAIGSGVNLGSGSITTGTNGTSFSCSSGKAVAIYVCDAAKTGGTLSVSDSAGNSGYASYGSVYDATVSRCQWFVNPNISASITSATASFSSSTSFTKLHAYCVSGLASSPTDFTPVGKTGGFNTSLVAETFTTASASELVIVGTIISGAGTITPSGSWVASTGMPSVADVGVDIYQIFSSVQTSQNGSGTLSLSNNWDTLSIGLKGASASSPTQAPLFFGSEI